MTTAPSPESLVIAVGGNALQPPGGDHTWDALDQTVEQIALLVQAGHRVALVHGNGPQVGDLLLQNEATSGRVPPAGLDVLDAETQGQLGYLIQRRLTSRLAAIGVSRPVLGTITQVVVDINDLALTALTKPIGPWYSSHAEARAAIPDGAVRELAPGRWRRVVASPRPQAIVELPALRVLWQAGVIAIACGGGGIPVVHTPDGLTGVAAVVDKDYAAQLLATGLGAERLVILTNVDGVYTGFGTAHARRVDRLTAVEALRLLTEGQLPAGSMGPKVQACLDFLDAGGGSAVIAAVPHAADAARGVAGTEVCR